MRININSAVELDYTEVGFGHAISNIYQSLANLGHTVSVNDKTAPLQFHWMQPDLCQPVGHAYNILYFPWESTKLRTAWKDMCNRPLLDEIWTTTPWCRDILVAEGIEKKEPIKVFQHGISSEWSPKYRTRRGPLKFLIVDAEANRKGWQEAFDAFRAVFQDDPTKATLTIKTRQHSRVRWFDEMNRVHSPQELANVNVVIGRVSNEEMVQMYQDHDVFLGPSYGEGFGFLPFQMLATGGPTICTREWAPYAHYLGDLALDSTYGETKWQGEHPGQVCYPDQKHLEELIRFVYDDFENQAAQFFSRSFDLHAEYDWNRLTKHAFENVISRFE